MVSCFAILSNSNPLILQMRKLIFEKGKALDWGVKKGGDVIFLKHLLCAAY